LSVTISPEFKIMETLKQTQEDGVKWFSVGGGRLAVFHRPKVDLLPKLQSNGCTHILTLLSENEKAEKLGRAVERLGLQWIWVPLPNGDPPSIVRSEELRVTLKALAKILSEGGSILIHCSAGIHRTGMISNALLRLLGLSAIEAKAALLQMRQVTHDGVGEHRLAWGEQFAA
jgi:protein-tyrosine phosphatase